MDQANVDLIMQDAEETQFYSGNSKYEWTSSGDNYLKYNETTHCANCSSDLVTEYILCEKCNINICFICFSNGLDFMNHKNNHDYRILTTNFILFENTDWTAQEELALLDSIATYGNWNFVAQELPTRSRTEIVEHYNYFYLKKNGSKYLPDVKIRDDPQLSPIITPYRFLLTDSDDPPRYISNTVGYQSLAGYNSARSEFECEYDKNAEDILSNMKILSDNDPLYKILSNLQIALVESYNRRLKERLRWKNIIRDNGLLLLRKVMSWLHRYDLTITRPVYEKLVRFMQFCEPRKFEMLMEGLHRAGELKIQISRYNTEYSWRNQNSNIQLPKLANRRSIFVPLEILGMPGYEKLTNKERDLCRSIRLVPFTYLELKDILVAEYKKMGYVKLQTARRLLKIDVNKTRKMHDFLVQEGYIATPKQEPKKVKSEKYS